MNKNDKPSATITIGTLRLEATELEVTERLEPVFVDEDGKVRLIAERVTITLTGHLQK